MTIDDLEFEDLLSDHSTNNDLDEHANLDDSIGFNNTDDDDIENNDDSIPTNESIPPVKEEPATPLQDNVINEDDDTSSIFFEYLKNKNFIIPNDDFNFDGTDESFEEAVIQTKDNLRLEVFGDLMGRLPEQVKEAVTFSLQTGGRDLDDYLNMNKSIDWDNLDLTNDDVQKAVMAHYYKNVSNFEDSKISKYIDRLEKMGELHEEALNVITEIKDSEVKSKEQALYYYQQQQAAQEEEARKYRAAIQASVEKASFIEDGRKQKVKNFLFNEKRSREGTYTDYDLTLSNIAKSAEHMAQLADLLLDYDPSHGFDLSRFKAKAKTDAVKGLKGQLSEIKSSARLGMSGTPSKESNKNNFNLESFLNTLR